MRDIAHHPWFENVIVGLIVLNALILGLETDPELRERYGSLMFLANDIILSVFILEIVLKMWALKPHSLRYFRDGWNIFDFSVVVLSLIPATGEWAMLARLARLLRVLRLISALPELRLIVATLVRSIPSMGHVIMLMSIIFYIYAIAGFHLFHQHDPQHWGSLGISLLTLFRVVTLEDWTDVMYTAMEMHAFAWIYFVSFVVMGTFVVINLFIAVVLNNLDEAKTEQLQTMKAAPTADALLEELRNTQAALDRLKMQLEGRMKEVKGTSIYSKHKS